MKPAPLGLGCQPCSSVPWCRDKRSRQLRLQRDMAADDLLAQVGRCVLTRHARVKSAHNFRWVELFKARNEASTLLTVFR